MASALILSATLLFHVCSAQVPVPGKPLGFTIGRGSGTAKVQLETYIDLLCPYSKAAYHGVKALANHYEPVEFRLKAVVFPLPFHQHGFTAAESVFTVTLALGDDHFTPWLEVLYENQERFWNKATSDLSAVQVTNQLKELAMKTFPSLTSTPQYTLNGVPFKEADSSWKLEDWLKVIDPLIKANRPMDG